MWVKTVFSVVSSRNSKIHTFFMLFEMFFASKTGRKFPNDATVEIKLRVYFVLCIHQKHRFEFKPMSSFVEQKSRYQQYYINQGYLGLMSRFGYPKEVNTWPQTVNFSELLEKSGYPWLERKWSLLSRNI